MITRLLQDVQTQGLEGLLRAINFAIERDELLHQRLKALAGKRVAIRLDLPGPLQGLAFDWTLAADGLLEDCGAQTPSGASPLRAGSSMPAPDAAPKLPPDVCLAISSEFFATAFDQALFAQPGQAPPSVMKGIRIEGDAAVAEQLAPLVSLLRERLSPMQQFMAQSPLAGLAQQAAHYAAHEGKLLVSREAMAEHQQGIRRLRDGLDRLEKRLDRMAGSGS